MIREDLLRNLPEQLYCLWDTETEGLNLVRSRPWQLSYTIYRGNKELESVDKFVWWDDLNISAEAAKVTGFDRERYEKEAKDPKEVFSAFHEYLYDSSIINVGHNILGFDIYMNKVVSDIKELEHSWDYLNNSIDTLALARGRKLGSKPDYDNFLAWQFRMQQVRTRGNKLEEVAKDFGITVDSSKTHDARYDTFINYKVFKQFINVYDI